MRPATYWRSSGRPRLYDMYSGIMPYLPGRHNRVYYLMEQLKDFIASRVKINEASFDSQNPRDFFDCFLIKMHQLHNIFPSLLDWVPRPHQRIFQNFKRLRDLIAHSVHDHQASLDPRSPRDFIDCFLTKMAEEEDPLSHFHMDTLLMTTHNLLFGGTETVGTTLRHAFLALMKYPKVQGWERGALRSEFRRRPATYWRSSRRPRLYDMYSGIMPYLPGRHNRVYYLIEQLKDFIASRVKINEASFDPQNPRDFFDCFLIKTHQASCYSWFSATLTPMAASHQFPDLCPFWETFCRWTEEACSDPFRGKDFYFPTWRTWGKRIFLGEGIARNELFLFFTTILQNFSMASPVAPEDIDLTPQECGVGKIPPKYHICFLPH
ncbi:PREDICTED: LOW QUALITY PROTEIN: cytochrome P450 2F5-like [Cercocebus atys]|uniref:LOW QUALITY PROTEIN: cytochrome P450 2F5-like n=1 Tax=Cercocebus atys TaxID=9531 RepID=UPI0005F57F00|nr:PREDICTED: LOW QUALITY PROTEIN: cytochrome P450 2F5-like [Cercocebus atys]